MSFLIYAFTVPSPVDLDHGAYLPLFLLYLSFQIPFWHRYTHCMANRHTMHILEDANTLA